MELNWTIEELIVLIGSSFLLLAGIISYKQYKKSRHRSLLFLSLTWLSLFIFGLLEVISYIFLETLIFKIHIIFLIISAFFMSFTVDSLSRISIDPIKMLILGIITAFALDLTFFNNSVIRTSLVSNGDPTLSSNGLLIWVASIFFLYGELLWGFYAIKIYIHTPKDLKNWAKMNLYGALIFGTLRMIIMASRLTMIIPGCGYIAIGIGVLLSTIAFIKEPELCNVLINISRNFRIQAHLILERKYKTMEYRYFSIFQAATDAIIINEIIFDRNHQPVDFYIKNINPAFENMFKTNAQEMVRKKNSEFFGSVASTIMEKYNDFLKNPLKNQKSSSSSPYQFELEMKSIEKTFLTSIFQMEKEQFFGLMFTDITKNKLENKERIKREKLESIGQLAGGLAHDFNNILTTILGNIQLAKMEIDAKNPLFEYFMEIEKSTYEGEKLTQNFITFAQGGAPMIGTFKITDLLNNLFKVVFISNLYSYQVDFTESLWAVKCDKRQIQRLFLNLFQNAKESMPNGGIIEISARNVTLNSPFKSINPGNYVNIGIQDHGVGIPLKYLKKIFDPYFSTKQRGSTKGMGLGLTTAYSIIHRHGGEIDVHSTENEGTLFEIYLPAVENL